MELEEIKRIVDKADYYKRQVNFLETNLDCTTPVIKITMGTEYVEILAEQELIRPILQYIINNFNERSLKMIEELKKNI